jgi:hypothetical protein
MTWPLSNQAATRRLLYAELDRHCRDKYIAKRLVPLPPNDLLMHRLRYQILNLRLIATPVERGDQLARA